MSNWNWTLDERNALRDALDGNIKGCMRADDGFTFTDDEYHMIWTSIEYAPAHEVETSKVARDLLVRLANAPYTQPDVFDEDFAAELGALISAFVRCGVRFTAH